MIYIPTPDKFPPLSDEEKALSMAKYYYRPMLSLDPVYERALAAGPLRPEEIPDPDKWFELVTKDEYNGSDFGYGIMEDGAGYLALYTRTAHPSYMHDWWFQWMNVRPKSIPREQGNICYKLWCPPDHFDSNSDEMKSTESLDLGGGDPMEEIFIHPLDAAEFGMSREQLDSLASAGVTVRVGYETFDHPGTHFTVRYSRPCAFGGYEEVSREWLGYKPQNGRLVRDESTPVSEEYLKKIMIHNAVEHYRLEAMLPELYKEYGGKPMDCD
ncbi:MAG: DAPG hydrolase family protein [Oscillospiraceae bacterium]